MNNQKINAFSGLLISLGMVIGFGIFFKVDNILKVNGGHAEMAILSWILVGVIILFAAYSVGNIVTQIKSPTGLGSIIEFLYSKKIGFFVTWFCAIIYVPVYVSMLSKYFGFYFGQLVEMSLLQSYLTSFIVISLVFSICILSQFFAVTSSKISSYLKSVPIIFIFLIGIFQGDINNFEISQSASSVPNNMSNTFLIIIAPFIAMFHAFDGWVAISALSTKLKNPSKYLLKIFVFAVVLALFLYLLFFVGIMLLMPVSDIVIIGDDYLFQIFTTFFGEVGTTVIMSFVLISGYGAINGFFMSGIGYVDTLVEKKQIPGFKKLEQKRVGFNYKTGIIVYIISLIYLYIFYLQDSIGILEGFNLEDWMLAVTSVIYLIIYVGIIKYSIINNFKTRKIVFSSIIALLGQFLIVLSYFLTNAKSIEYFIVAIIIIFLAYISNLLFNKEFSLNN